MDAETGDTSSNQMSISPKIKLTKKNERKTGDEFLVANLQ